MATLQDEVRSVVTGFMQSNELFTALDVSNKVKMTLPFARHREVRDLVREMFTTDLEPANWARTPINVVLNDGSTAEALLYHPLSDSWDLDNKYDAQKRAQGTVKAQPTVTSATVSSNGTVNVNPQVQVSPTLTQVQAKDRWAQLFTSQPSLFPLK
jgi:hypothetical protein